MSDQSIIGAPVALLLLSAALYLYFYYIFICVFICFPLYGLVIFS